MLLNFKIRDLWNRLVLDVPENEFAKALVHSVCKSCGEVVHGFVFSKWQ